MFCSKCGLDAQQAKFCPGCGAALESSVQLDANSPEIRSVLQKHNNLIRDIRCLGCGYQGSMGIVRVTPAKIPWLLTWPVILPSIFCLFGVILLVLRVLKNISPDPPSLILRCPACNKDLTKIGSHTPDDAKPIPLPDPNSKFIRNRLRRYSRMTKEPFRCAACRYVGPMGILKVRFWFLKWYVLLIALPTPCVVAYLASDGTVALLSIYVIPFIIWRLLIDLRRWLFGKVAKKTTTYIRCPACHEKSRWKQVGPLLSISP